MSGLFLKRAIVEGLRPIKKFEATFDVSNTLIGPNGSGKTNFIHLLATVAGCDEATHLLKDEPIGYVRLEFQYDSNHLVFEAHDSLELSKIIAFKEQVSTHERINLGLAEDYLCRFAVDNIDHRAYHSNLRKLAEKCKDITFDYRGNGPVSLPHGDGRNQAFLLCLLAAQAGGILLVETPERHLDLYMKRHMSFVIQTGNKQIIQTTHSPEWIIDEAKIIEI